MKAERSDMLLLSISVILLCWAGIRGGAGHEAARELPRHDGHPVACVPEQYVPVTMHELTASPSRDATQFESESRSEFFDSINRRIASLPSDLDPAAHLPVVPGRRADEDEDEGRGVLDPEQLLGNGEEPAVPSWGWLADEVAAVKRAREKAFDARSRRNYRRGATGMRAYRESLMPARDTFSVDSWGASESAGSGAAAPWMAPRSPWRTGSFRSAEEWPRSPSGAQNASGALLP